MEGGLWYHYVDDTNNDQVTRSNAQRLSSQADYELWYHHIGHPNPTCLCNMHKYARGVPKLKQSVFHRYPSCSTNIKKDTGAPTKHNRVKHQVVEERICPGQHLHMDFGFVRGSAFKDKDDQGCIITSIDGFRSYLIIVDRATRYKWLLLTSTKHPPIQEVDSIIKKFHPSLHVLHITIRTDQGGELGKLHKFRDLLKKYEY